MQHLVNIRLAEMILRERTAAGLTQAQLAKKSGTHQTTISELENADSKRGNTIDLVQRIAKALGKNFAFSFTE